MNRRFARSAPGQHDRLAVGGVARGFLARPAPVKHSLALGDNETNYCVRWQTGGRMLADRSLSRLLHADWPRTLDEWEARRRPTG